MTNIEKILINGHAVQGPLIDSFDSAIVGVTGEEHPRLVYSYNIIVRILKNSGWTLDDVDAYIDGLKLLRGDDILIIYTVDYLPEG